MNVFASYAHQDRTLVRRIVDGLRDAGHNVRMDERFAAPGDPLATKIRTNIHASDFVALFLSPQAVTSPWVDRELFETLLMELETRKSALIPCLLQRCQFPQPLQTEERLYVDLRGKNTAGVEALVRRISEGKSPIFHDENYSVLNISLPGLEIYLTGESWGPWGEKNSQLKYDETIDRYLLFGFEKQSGTYFKHFVLCEQDQAPRVREALDRTGYPVTGVGTPDEGTGKRKVWFLDRRYPVERENNRWP